MNQQGRTDESVFILGNMFKHSKKVSEPKLIYCVKHSDFL